MNDHQPIDWLSVTVRITLFVLLIVAAVSSAICACRMADASMPREYIQDPAHPNAQE
jgi:hypothetical protein